MDEMKNEFYAMLNSMEEYMSYNQDLAKRIIKELNGLPGLQEKKMFGGVGYILRGNMACGIVENDLVVRTGPDAYESALTRPYTHPFDKFGRSMSGWILVETPGFERDEDLHAWIWLGVEYAGSLPEK